MFPSRDSNNKPGDRPIDRIPSATLNPMDRIPSDRAPASQNPMDRIPLGNGYGDRFAKNGNGDKPGGFSSRPPFRG